MWGRQTRSARASDFGKIKYSEKQRKNFWMETMEFNSVMLRVNQDNPCRQTETHTYTHNLNKSFLLV